MKTSSPDAFWESLNRLLSTKPQASPQIQVKVPRVVELAVAQEVFTRTAPRPSPPSIFREAFGKSYERLREDAEKHPDKYRDELHTILEKGVDEGNINHQQLLREAVLDYFRAPTKKSELEPRLLEAEVEKEASELGDPETEIVQEEFFDIDGLPAFWWLDEKAPAPG